MDCSILINWTSPFRNLGVSGILFLRSAASDLGLHCLPGSQERDARLIWVKSQ